MNPSLFCVLFFSLPILLYADEPTAIDHSISHPNILKSSRYYTFVRLGLHRCPVASKLFPASNRHSQITVLFLSLVAVKIDDWGRTSKNGFYLISAGEVGDLKDLSVIFWRGGRQPQRSSGPFAAIIDSNFYVTDGVVRASGKVLFIATQWQELERQTIIYKDIMASVPIPPQLLLPSSTQSNRTSTGIRFSNGSDPESWRYRRTDGKNGGVQRMWVPTRSTANAMPTKPDHVQESLWIQLTIPLQLHQISKPGVMNGS